MSYRLLAEDIKELLEEEHIRHANIIGHSLGGKAAIQFSLLWPEYVDRLVVVDTAPTVYDHGKNTMKLIQSLFALRLDKCRTLEEAKSLLDRNIRDRAFCKTLLTNLSEVTTPVGEKKIKWNLDLGAIASSAYNLVYSPFPETGPDKKIPSFQQGQVLFIRGTQSKYLDAPHQLEAKHYFPNAIFESIDAGHNLAQEEPDRFLDLVTSFLSQDFVRATRTRSKKVVALSPETPPSGTQTHASINQTHGSSQTHASSSTVPPALLHTHHDLPEGVIPC
jgi:pimeloyl-ACP methyl ester carboxylesterase